MLEQWQSASINELAHAIVQAQKAMKPAVKDCSNPFFKSKYADLSSVRAALAPFTDAGIAITQSPMESAGEQVILDTQLTHTSGQWMRSRLTMPVAKNDPQGMGSALTYARRYALGCMTGLVTEEDDDGNAAQLAAGPKVSAWPPHKQTAQAKIHELRQEGAAPSVSGVMVSDDVVGPSSSDAPSAFTWRVGKYKGTAVEQLPVDYLIWAMDSMTKFPDHQNAARAEIDRRHAQETMQTHYEEPEQA